ncbi:hypothetical protein Acy02nite_15220 [Actinoplanes cyaneus]|uniref:DUF4190 domain-containing protein n=1 Tax=Actinoplanes cyaneus TaxID=52696 RepID=A0A919IFY1_9ACTN|nr:hypothetical protein [Actinoplanes cyaneus]MCW2142201.1 hypothetical protein [Actinoplanes cyaneus]GID63641.1 hypothetical protein Acy02nite_15220 [Actinoplanes cyaneus]
MICTHCGSPAAPTVGLCPGCGRRVATPAPPPGGFADPVAAPAEQAFPTSAYGVPVDPFTGPTTGDPFTGPTTGDPFAGDSFHTPPTSPMPTSPMPSSGVPAPQAYTPPAQSSGHPPVAPYSPPPAQPFPGQPYPGQPYAAQPYPGQPYPGQPYPGQQPYPGYEQSNSQVLTILSYVLGGFGILVASPLIAIVGLVLANFAKRNHERKAQLAIRIVAAMVIIAVVRYILELTVNFS